MPARTLLPGLLLGIIGLLAVSWLVLLRRDVDRASSRGPRWRRHIVTSGLLLLAALGFSPPANAGEAPRAGSVSASPEWKRITRVWGEAAAIASGKRGSYPFDRAGKKRVLAELEEARKLVDALAVAGKISASAAGLLKLRLKTLSYGVGRKRPTEMRKARCYRRVMHQPRRESYNRLKARLPHLEKLARARKVQPVVLRKVVAAIEGDLKVVGEGKAIDRLAPKEQKQAPGVVKRVRDSLARIKKLTR